MKICAIGDLHGKIPKSIPKDIDLILLTGDLGSAKLAREMAFENIERERKGLPEIEYSAKQEKNAFMEAYNSTMKSVKYLQTLAPVFTIFGNVESSNQDTKKDSRKLGVALPYLSNNLNSIKNIRVINNRIANFKGVRIGGLKYFVDTSWVREFKPSDYKERLAKSKKQTKKAKKVLQWFDKVDILLCHQPPYGILDKVGKMAPKKWQGKHAGSKTILDYIKKKQPKSCICGHIHEAEGKKKVGKTQVYNLGCGSWKVLEF